MRGQRHRGPPFDDGWVDEAGDLHGTLTRLNPWTAGRLDRCVAGRCWCSLQDANLPPLTCEASALLDELTSTWRTGKKGHSAAPGGETTLRARRAWRRVRLW